MMYLNVASTSQDMNLACIWIEDSTPSPSQPPPYSQVPMGGAPYPPQNSFGPPPPYSGGPGFAPTYSNQPAYQQAAPPGQYGVGLLNYSFHLCVHIL